MEDGRLSVVLARLDRGQANFGFRGFYEVRLEDLEKGSYLVHLGDTFRPGRGV